MDFEQFKDLAYNKIADAIIEGLENHEVTGFDVKDSEDAAEYTAVQMDKAKTPQEVVKVAFGLVERYPKVFSQAAMDIKIASLDKATIEAARPKKNN